MNMSDGLTVYCPQDGDAIDLVGGPSVPGWFVVVHKHDEEIHDFEVYFDGTVAP